jgi:glutathione synthase/RimK-type ligase-like ATP-grasp enzyme
MKTLIITESREDWPDDIEGTEVVDAFEYLTQSRFHRLRSTRLVNLCRSYRYQSIGYYVSLLAEARGSRPMPNVMDIQDLQLRNQAVMRILPDDLDEIIQKGFAALHSDKFTLSVYFGRNLAARYDRLSRQLFEVFHCPLLQFTFVKQDRWQLRFVRALSAEDLQAAHREFAVEAARSFLASRAVGGRGRKRPARYDLAILHDPTQTDLAPSNPKALEKFVRAAEKVGLDAELVTRDDFGQLLEFDALFIRETTRLNHYTFRWSRRAAREGLAVIDDPQSIARCTNKVFLAENLQRHDLAMPKTVLVQRDSVRDIAEQLGFPCVLKKPDSAFSLGVIKVESAAMLEAHLAEFFGESELLVAQEFLPTDFDWRIGILDQRPLYACKYFMARGHWQIVRAQEDGRRRYGKCEALPIETVPRKAVALALKAANLIGDGLYGVDVKESQGKFYVIEVNDNPNLDAGVEDAILRDELYLKIMTVFLQKIEKLKAPTYD